MKISTLHKIIRLLRKIRLLYTADLFLYIKDRYVNFFPNRNFISSNRSAEISSHQFPPPHLAFDAYGSTNYRFYYESGLDFAQMLSKRVHEYAHNASSDKIKILEWGCGPGRIIQHLGKLLSHDEYELYGSDYNLETIEWCQNHLKNITFLPNGLRPPFTYKSNYLNCIFAISVFTHLSLEMNLAWIQELNRVLKVNGVAIITTHGDTASKDRLTALEKFQYDSGDLVVKDNVKEGKKWYLSYHSPKFVKNVLLKDFEILFFGQLEKNSYQDIWIARKIGDKLQK